LAFESRRYWNHRPNIHRPFLGIFIFIKRLNRYVDVLEDNKKDLSEEDFERRLINLDKAEVDHILKSASEGF